MLFDVNLCSVSIQWNHMHKCVKQLTVSLGCCYTEYNIIDNKRIVRCWSSHSSILWLNTFPTLQCLFEQLLPYKLRQAPEHYVLMFLIFHFNHCERYQDNSDTRKRQKHETFQLYYFPIQLTL